jgi:hypothetical protein
MNHHADKLRKETHPDDASAFDSALDGVIEELHTLPAMRQNGVAPRLP